MNARGRPRHDDILTPAEWRTVQFVRHGLSNAKIARLQNISVDGVKYHVENAIAKLGLTSRAALRTWRGVPKSSALHREKDRMSTALKLGPIGQISRSVRNIKVAEEWYGKTLGLPHLFTFGKLAFFDCDGTRLYLQESDTPGPESVLYLKVANIDQAYRELQSRGVEFVGAPHMIHKHADGTEEWMAFFNDSEGRPLAIISQAQPLQR